MNEKKNISRQNFSMLRALEEGGKTRSKTYHLS